MEVPCAILTFKTRRDAELVSTARVKYCNISNTFLTFFSNKILVIKAGIHQMLVRIAKREDPDQTASEEAV